MHGTSDNPPAAGARIAGDRPRSGRASRNIARDAGSCSLKIGRVQRLQRGFSLLEVLAAIVVMGIVFAGFVSVYATVLKHGSDAELHGQAVATASAYLEEILSRPYRDPDDGTLCGTPEAARPAFDDACDYDALAVNGCAAVSGACPVPGACACDRSGSPVDGLPAFDVSVLVNPTTLSGAAGLQIRVDVTHDGLAGGGVTLVAFRSED